MKKPEDVISEIRSAEGETFIVVLEHRYSFLKRLSKLGVNLILCGHSHAASSGSPSPGVIGRRWTCFRHIRGPLFGKRHKNAGIPGRRQQYGSSALLNNRDPGCHT
jgi:hypothetical protein